MRIGTTTFRIYPIYNAIMKYVVFPTYSNQYFLLFQLYSEGDNIRELKNHSGYLKFGRGGKKLTQIAPGVGYELDHL